MQPTGPLLTKVCSKCKTEKSVELFYVHKILKDGYRSECIDCTLKQNLEYAKNNLGKIREIKRKSWYKSGYGVDVAFIDFLIKDQDEKCLICDLRVPLEYDHCHVSKKTRGMLCTKCNKALGLFNDNSSVLRKAADYIDAH